jgi:glycosyltransferase involved in cell wall biosynthesis
MLRVLTLSTLFPDSGRPTFGVFVERQTLELARHPDAEVEVVAGVGLPPWPLSRHPHYAPRRTVAREEVRNGLRVHRPRFRVLPRLETRSAISLARAALPLLRTLRSRFPFDVIDAEFFWPDGVAAMHVSRALGVPFSIKARGSDIHFWGERPSVRRQMLDAAQTAGGLLAVSERLRESMVALGMPGEKIRVHHTGIDLDRFVPSDRDAGKARLGLRGPLLASAGALIPLKGQALVIEAVRSLPDATLVLIGDGPERAALQRRAEACGVADRVRFLGNRPHHELPSLLAAADIMVLPSEREGLANVWLEAIACGTPIIVTDVGGVREVVTRPEAGRIVARTSDAIAAAAREILADPPSAAAVRLAAEGFSWTRNAEALVEHLRKVSGDRH